MQTKRRRKASRRVVFHGYPAVSETFGDSSGYLDLILHELSHGCELNINGFLKSTRVSRITKDSKHSFGIRRFAFKWCCTRLTCMWVTWI